MIGGLRRSCGTEKEREDWLRRYEGGTACRGSSGPELMPAQREATKRRIHQEFMTSQRLYGHLEG